MNLPRLIKVRAVVPVTLAVIAVAVSATVLVAPYPDSGIHLAYDNGEVVVQSVDYGSRAQLSGLPRPGEVVEWLDGTYVPSQPDQAKRDIANQSVPRTTISTISREQATADKATLAKLVVVARQSAIPWLSNPEENALPACFGDGSCLPNAEQPMPDGSTLSYGYSMYMDAVCIPTDGNQLFTIPGPAVPAPSNPSEDTGMATIRGGLCVSASAWPGAASRYAIFGWQSQSRIWDMSWPPISRDGSLLVLGLAILLFGWLVVGRGWAGSELRRYALTLPVATAVPLIVMPIDRYPTLAANAFVAVIVPLAMLPLAIDFLGRLDRGRGRSLLVVVTVGLALASAAAGIMSTGAYSAMTWRAFLAGCVVFVAGLFAARPFHRLESGAVPGRSTWRGIAASGLGLVPGPQAAGWSRRLGSGSSSSSGRTPRALIESVDILLAAMTPGIAAICLTSSYSVRTWPIVLWLAAIFVAARLIVRPLGRLATGALRQRDLVVAATEAERSRIAADIHDDALQDLTMLIRRLDAAGDTANADAARDVAERLRAICGDLRLPVLDDLGVGPALEWLCSRAETSVDSLVLDRLADESRLPADVELAVFRVAQEALSNAVKHGSSPIVVRYRSRPDWVELVVDDSGSGLPDGAAEAAELAGHLGLLNMTQRAEAVGADFRIGPRPGGGTRVSLIWQRSAATGRAPAAVPASA
jgi:signal transduction histidine kinase